RHGTQGASLGAGRAALCARPTGAAAPERFSALRPPLDSGSVKQGCKTPGAKNAPRERDGLFDIVRWELPKTVRQRTASSACPEPPHPEERACRKGCANSRGRARVSKDEDVAHMLRDAALRAAPQHEGTTGTGQNQPAAVGNDWRLRSIASGLLFTMNSATPTCRAVSARPGRAGGEAAGDSAAAGDLKLAPLFAARCRIRMAATADRSMHLQTAWPRLARRLICET